MGRFSGELIRVQRDGLTGYIDFTGREIISCQFQDGLNTYSDGLIPVKQYGKWGYINLKAETVINFIYDSVHVFSEGYAQVIKDGKSGFIDVKGNTVISFDYDPDELDGFKNNFAAIKKNGKWGYINKTGKIIIPFQYDNPSYYGTMQNRLRICRDKLYGLCDTMGNITFDLKYNRIYVNEMHQDQFYIKKDEKYGIVDTNEREIIPVQYSDLIGGKSGVYMATKKGKMGYLDLQGKTVIPFKYNGDKMYHSIFDGQYVSVRFGNLERLIDKNDSCMLGCLENGNVLIKSTGGVIEISGAIKSSLRIGKWTYNYENGNTKEISNYKKGLLNGKQERWNKNGILTYSAIYKNNKLNGKERKFDSTGILTSEVTYVKGIRKRTDKRLTTYYLTNGRINSRGHYKRSGRAGYWEEGDSDTLGNYMVAKGHYKKGEKTGLWNYYGQSNTLLFTEHYVKGNLSKSNGPFSTYNRYSKVYYKGNLKQGMYEGERLTYLFDGTCIKKEHYSEDVLTGESIEYYRNGKIKTSGNYQLVKIIHDLLFIITDRHTGNTDSTYFIAKKTGKWRHYHENGQLRLEEHFELKTFNPSDTTFILKNSDSLLTSPLKSFIQNEYIPTQYKIGIETEYDDEGKIVSVGSYYPIPVCYNANDEGYTVEDPENPGTMIVASPSYVKQKYLKDGVWKYYEKNGKLLKEELYDKGTLK